MEPATARPRRLTAEQRRRQLVGLGLELLTERSILEVSLDEVARRAGISRGLLFHYFPTKRAFYAAVVQAAAQRLVRAVTPPAGTAAEDRLEAALTGYVGFLVRRRDPYLALVRGTGGDPHVVEVLDATREELAALVGEAAALPPTPAVRTLVRAWLAFAEELVLTATAGPDGIDVAGSVALLTESLHRLATLPLPDRDRSRP